MNGSWKSIISEVEVDERVIICADMISSMRSRLVNVGSMIWRFGANHAMYSTMSHCVLELPWPTDFESHGLDCRQPLVLHRARHGFESNPNHISNDRR